MILKQTIVSRHTVRDNDADFHRFGITYGSELPYTTIPDIRSEHGHRMRQGRVKLGISNNDFSQSQGGSNPSPQNNHAHETFMKTLVFAAWSCRLGC